MGAPTKCKPKPMLTRKKLREYSYNLAELYLPKELEDYLLDIYNEEDFLDDEGHRRSLTDEDIWYNVRRPIYEYAQLKNKIDDLFSDTEYLGNCTLTIRVHKKRAEFVDWVSTNTGSSNSKTLENEGSDDIIF